MRRQHPFVAVHCTMTVVMSHFVTFLPRLIAGIALRFQICHSAASCSQKLSVNGRLQGTAGYFFSVVTKPVPTMYARGRLILHGIILLAAVVIRMGQSNVFAKMAVCERFIAV
jgi:hypothetical protein